MKLCLNLMGRSGAVFENPPARWVECYKREFGFLCQDAAPQLGLAVEFRKRIKRTGVKTVGWSFAFMNSDGFGAFDRNRAAALLYPDNSRILVEEGFDPLYFYNVFLFPFWRMKLVEHGSAFLHASGFEYNGKTIVVSAWGGTGKTNTLIEFLRRGAAYLGDDMLIIDRAGVVFPYPRPLNLFDYNIERFPFLRKHITFKKRLLFMAKRLMERACHLSELLPQDSIGRMTGAHLARVGKAAVNLKVTPPEVWPECTPRTNGARADLLLQLVKGQASAEESAACTLLDRLAISFQACIDYEAIEFHKYCCAFAFLGNPGVFVVDRTKELDVYKSFLKRVGRIFEVDSNVSDLAAWLSSELSL